jgi:hypothetical protein
MFQALSEVECPLAYDLIGQQSWRPSGVQIVSASRSCCAVAEAGHLGASRRSTLDRTSIPTRLGVESLPRA